MSNMSQHNIKNMVDALISDFHEDCIEVFNFEVLESFMEILTEKLKIKCPGAILEVDDVEVANHTVKKLIFIRYKKHSYGFVL